MATGEGLRCSAISLLVCEGGEGGEKREWAGQVSAQLPTGAAPATVPALETHTALSSDHSSLTFIQQECPLCLLHSEALGPGDTVLSFHPKAHRASLKGAGGGKGPTKPCVPPTSANSHPVCPALPDFSNHLNAFWKVKRLFHSENMVGLFVTIQAM